MKINKKKVKRILIITLSNIGDAVLTTAVVQVLRENFPQAHIAVLVGPRAFSVFKSDQRIDNKIIYDKAISWKHKLMLVNRLRMDRYDLVVDLRQSAFTIFLGARYHSSVLFQAPKSLVHMKDRHLWKLKSLGMVIDENIGPSVQFSEDEQDNINRMFVKWQIRQAVPLVAVSPGARNMTKRWKRQGYRELIIRLIKEYKAKIIMIGDDQDKLLVEEIISQIRPAPFNACGRTSIGELTCLLQRCELVVSNDSAPMHLAWAVQTPVVAIFGPTDYRKYGPGGKYDVIIRKQLPCAPCEKSLCPCGSRECMKTISVDEVFSACKKILDLPRPS